MANGARTNRLTLLVLAAVVAGIVGFGLWFLRPAERPVALVDREAAAAEPAPTLHELPGQLERAPLVASAPMDAPAKPEVTTLPLENGLVRLRGRVLDLAGQPVADQAVHGEDEPDHIVARSQNDGTFATEPVPDAILLVADSANYVCLRGVRLPSPDGAIIVVAPAIAVSGFVVDETGAGIADASIAMPEATEALARFPEPLDRTTPIQSAGTMSNSEGRFTYERAAAGAGMRLTASRDGYNDASVDVPEIARDDLRIVLAKNQAGLRTLTGVVVHQDGSPATEAQVQLGDVQTATDARGAFTLKLPDWLPDAEALVAVESGSQAAFVPDYGRVLRELTTLPPPVRLVLGSTPLSITGRVVDAQGVPSPEWIVALANPTLARAGYIPLVTVESMSSSSSKTVVTSENGAFVLEGLLDREYTLFAYHTETLVRVETRPVPAGTRNLDIVVPNDACFAKVTGHVLAPDGTPIAEAVVSLGLVTARTSFSQAWISGKSITTKGDGSFELSSVPRQFVHLNVGGDLVIPQHFPITDVDATKPVVLTVARRCHFRVEGLPLDDETRSLAAQDKSGNELSISLFQEGGWASSNRQSVTKDRTRVFAVSEAAAELLLYFPSETMIAKRAVRLVPGEVTVVKW